MVLSSFASFPGVGFIMYVILQYRKDSKFKFHLHLNQQTDITKDYSGILRKDQSREIVGNFYHVDKARVIKLDVDCLNKY